MILAAILGTIFGIGLIFMFLMYPAQFLMKKKSAQRACKWIKFIIRFHKGIGTIVLIDTMLYLIFCFKLFPFSWMAPITMLIFIFVAISGFFIEKGEKSRGKFIHQWGAVVLLLLALLYTKIK